MTPLEDSDEFFSLEVNHLNLKKYSEMIANSTVRDDLDLISTNYSPKSGHIIIDMPSIEKELFSTKSYDYLGHGDSNVKLSMQPSLPVPQMIAVHVFNSNKTKENMIDFGKDIFF